MATYRMDDGTILKTENAIQSWKEETRFDGNNNVSVHTNNQWTHQTLYKSRKGRYYIEHTSQWQGATPRAEWVSNHEAVRWLLLNEDKIPADLAALVEEIEE